MKNTIEQEIYGNVELWETGELGSSKETAKISSFSVEDLQKSIQLQAISLRIQKDVLENLKFIAQYHGIGYQPLIKQILRRFVDSEINEILKKDINLQPRMSKRHIG
jgi:uncharacterized protein PM1122